MYIGTGLETKYQIYTIAIGYTDEDCSWVLYIILYIFKFIIILCIAFDHYIMYNNSLVIINV